MRTTLLRVVNCGHIFARLSHVRSDLYFYDARVESRSAYSHITNKALCLYVEETPVLFVCTTLCAQRRDVRFHSRAHA